MSIDAQSHLAAVERAVSSAERDGLPALAVTMSQSFETTVEDLWDAVTNAERIPRWFTPVSGDLRLGGRYQLEGNAEGDVTACEPMSGFALTWEFGGDVSWVDVSLAEQADGRVRLALTHTSLLSEQWNEYGPGAAGVGWELGLLGLDLHITQPDAPKPDVEEFVTSAEGLAIIAGSSDGWAQASIAAGTPPDAAREAAARTTAFYTGQPA